MSSDRWGVEAARDDIIGGPRGKRGAEFLICFGATLLLCGAAAFFVPPEVTAILMLSQSGPAIPAALVLERLRGARVSANNPLWPLLFQLLAVQVVALPAVFLVWAADVRLVPAALAFGPAVYPHVLLGWALLYWLTALALWRLPTAGRP